DGPRRPRHQHRAPRRRSSPPRADRPGRGRRAHRPRTAAAGLDARGRPLRRVRAAPRGGARGGPAGDTAYPLRRGDRPAPRRPGARAGRGHPAARPRDPRRYAVRARVLVVDDNPLDRRITCLAAEHLGHRPEPAEDGDTALRMLVEDGGFDVVLLDLMMPGTDGFAVLTAMRADERLRHLPVIVVSAADAMDDVVHSIALGATDHLTKPLRAPLLEARLTASLAGKCLRDVELDHLAQLERVIAAAVSLQHGSQDLSVLD